jgi:antitoxin component YwqK of YwqJK toxin-antitoxin module
MDSLKHFIVENTFTGISVNNLKQGNHYDCGIGGIGQLSGEYNHLDGKEHGIGRRWYSNGEIASEYNYLNGREHGICRHWHNSGQIWREYNYLNGEFHGICRDWHSDGPLWREESYLNGVVRKL